jgi:phage I-like protein
MARKPKIEVVVPSAKFRALAISAAPVGLVDGKAPSEFRIFHYGKNTSTKGPFLFDEKAADAVMAYFKQRGLVLKADYEHQTFNTVKNGQPAPNSCKAWDPAIRVDQNGKPEFWATNVQWTDRARQMIEAGEYSYFSPAFDTDDDERVTAVLNFALTNLPALDNIDELIAASAAVGEQVMKKMKCSQCDKNVKAPTDDDDGDDVACMACFNKAKAAKKATALSMAIGVDPNADETVALTAAQELVVGRDELKTLTSTDSINAALGVIRGWKESHNQVTALRAEIEGGKQTARNKEFGDLLDRAMTEKRITKDFRETYWEKTHAPGGNATDAGLVQLRAFIGTAPVIGGATPPKPPKQGPGPLPAQQLAMAKEMGFDAEKLKRFETDREAQMTAGG